MAHRRLHPAALACAAFALAAATPALAHEGMGGDPRPPFPGDMHSEMHGDMHGGMHWESGIMMPPPERDAWLGECQDRMSMGEHGRHAREYAHDRCVNYLEDYYAYYRDARPMGPPPGYAPTPAYGYGAPYAYGYAMQAPAGPCCQPMVVAPPPPPKCKEVVEYEYVDVPVRRHHYRPRPAPEKRVKIVPDKRVRTK